MLSGHYVVIVVVAYLASWSRVNPDGDSGGGNRNGDI